MPSQPSGQLPFDWLAPAWPAPTRVKACVTTASHGHSLGDFASCNLGDHVGDDVAAVAANRQLLADKLGCKPVWLDQVHGIKVVEAKVGRVLEADASWSQQAGIACAILTADCLPVLFAAKDTSCVAAAHAGWRSLQAGVLEQTLAALPVSASEVMVWLGPAISQAAYEVGAEVYQAFVEQNPACASAFIPSERDGHWLADLYQLARIRLAGAGVEQLYGGGFCTKTDKRFYSYRRQPVTGRFASLIWLDV